MKRVLLPFYLEYMNIILFLEHDRQAPAQSHSPSRTFFPWLFPLVTPSSPSRLCTAVTFSETPILTNLFKIAVCLSSTQPLSLLFLFIFLCFFFTFCLLMLEYKRARIFFLLCLLMHFMHIACTSHNISSKKFF